MRRSLSRLAVALAMLVAGLVEVGSANVVAATGFPSMSGTWQVAAEQCPGTCTDVWTITPVNPDESPPSVYNITSAKGFYAKDVAIAPNGGSVFKETCDGCTGYSLLKLTFHSSSGKNTFAGTWQPFDPRSNAPGSPLYPGGIGKETGYESSAPQTTSLSVSVAPTSSTLAAGDDVGVTVTLTAGGEALTSVRLEQGLVSSDRSVVVLSTTAPDLRGFDLAAGTSRTFAFRATAGQGGTATLSATASATASSGPAQGSGQAVLTVTGLTFDYSMPERYSEAALTTSYAQPKSYSVFFTVEHGRCDRDADYTWFVDGKQVAAQRAEPCVFRAEFDKLGTYSVRLAQRGRTGNQEASFTKEVVVQDFLVAALGDSLASGEGSPPYIGASDCDRSKLSYGAQAAKRLEGADPRSSVTFLQLACSGANMDPIPMGPGLAGKASRASTIGVNTVYHQLLDLKELVGERQIDALTLSIGINSVVIHLGSVEIGFAKLVALCVGENRCQDQCVSIADCSGLHKILPPSLGGSKQPWTVADLMPDAIDELPGLYDQLHDAITAVFPESQLKPSDVYLVAYPDPLHDETGGLCPVVVPRGGDGSHGGFENINGEDEVTWFEQAFMLPLLRAEGRAAAQFGWHYVDPNAAFATHGYCSTSSWFVHLSQLTSGKMNPSGIFHPNSVGQAVLADNLYDVMSPSLLPDGQARKP